MTKIEVNEHGITMAKHANEQYGQDEEDFDYYLERAASYIGREVYESLVRLESMERIAEIYTAARQDYQESTDPYTAVMGYVGRLPEVELNEVCEQLRIKKIVLPEEFDNSTVLDSAACSAQEMDAQIKSLKRDLVTRSVMAWGDIQDA